MREHNSIAGIDGGHVPKKMDSRDFQTTMARLNMSQKT